MRLSGKGLASLESSYRIDYEEIRFFRYEKNGTSRPSPLLSYRDIRDAIIENFIQEEKNFEEKLLERHFKRQKDINRYYKKPNLLK